MSWNKKTFRPFKEARKFVRTLKLGGLSDWREHWKTHKRPDDIPANPDTTYKKQGTWTDWPDFLGYEAKFQRRQGEAPSYEEWFDWAKKNGINNPKDYMIFDRAKVPKNYPAGPQRHYAKRGTWKGWPKPLWTKIDLENAPSYEEYKKWAQTTGEKTKEEFLALGRENVPKNYPVEPRQFYKKQGTWKNWGDLLGSGRIANQNREYRSFEEARKFVHKLKIKNKTEWGDYVKLRKHPTDIPNDPRDQYKNKGWTSWGDFLDTGTIAAQNIRQHMLSYEEAEIEAHKICAEQKIDSHDDWNKAWDEGKIPKNLPRNPWNFYGELQMTGKKKKK